MYEQLLTQSGLNYSESLIYELLLKEGMLTAGQINKKTPIKRGLVYKTLDDLMEKDLIAKIDAKSKVTQFKAQNPTKLGNIVDRAETEVRRKKGVIDKLIPQLVSDFSLSSNKPRVQYYEGMEGLKILMDDTLKSTTEIYSYADVEAVHKRIKRINDNYVKKRDELSKQKKILVIKSEFNRVFFEKLGSEVTDVKYLDFDLQTKDLVINIYDNKVSYSTLDPATMIGIIIENKLIASMQKSLFVHNWQNALATAT